MALANGTNCGFCSSAPSADPGGSSFPVDERSTACGDTSDSTATRVTEVGWWCDNATEAADFEVGLYDDNAGEPGDLLYSSTGHAKGTGSGWKTVTGLNWSISGSTKYWIAIQVDNTSTQTDSDRAASGGEGYSYDRLVNTTALGDPWSVDTTDSNGMAAIYAVWDTGGGGGNVYQINIGDAWKTIDGMQINIGDTWRTVTGLQINIGDSWKTIF